MRNPYEKYQQQMVSTMSQADMLLKLYDETVKQIDKARGAIIEKNVPDMEQAINKANRIVRYLRSVLNEKYEVSVGLKSLYTFIDSQLVLASVKKSTEILNDIEPLVQELRDTFNQCAKMDRADRSGPTIADVV